MKVKKNIASLGMPGFLPGLLLGILLLMGAVQANAQYDNILFKLKPALQQGTLFYRAGAYEKAIPHLKVAYEQEQVPELLLMLGHAHALTGDASGAIRYYQKTGDTKTLEARHLLAYTLSLQSVGRLQEARAHFQVYLQQTGADEQLQEDLGRSELYRAAIRYSVHPLSLNTRQHEFAPVLTNAGLLFVSDRHGTTLSRRSFSGHAADLDVYSAQSRSNTRFVNYKRLGRTVNSTLHEGPASLDSANNLYFSRSEKNGSISLWSAQALEEESGWKKAERLKIPATGNFFHPAISADGQRIYFVSDREGGAGGTDIYYSQYQNGAWSAPVNAGEKVNTAGNEAFPVLHQNKLYFSSDGRIGLGGMDIYEAYISNSAVLHVRNMGAPVNSEGDDFGLVWQPDGSGGYFASNRTGSRGGDDLYRLDYHIINLEGLMLDSTNREPLAGVKIELQQPDGTIRQAVSDKQGNYRFSLFPGERYKLRYDLKNYRTVATTYSTLQGKQYGKRQLTTALERKTRIFVVGNVRFPDRKKAAQAQVIVYDRTGSLPDTLYANERGGFDLELDTESYYTFLFSCEGFGGVAEFQTAARTEASLSHYLNVDLVKQQQYQVRGKVEGAATELPLVVWLTNSITGETSMLWTENSSFRFPATSLATYEICVQQGGKTASLQLNKEWSEGKEREVVLQLK